MHDYSAPDNGTLVTTRPTSLLLSKFKPPGLSGKSLRRDALIEELTTNATKAVLIEAPAGNGKTTLMEQVYSALRMRDISVAWLTLDAYDNTAEELVQYLGRLLLEAGILGSDDEKVAQDILDGQSPRASLAALLGKAASVGRRAVILLDDVHLLTCPGCLSLIRMLIEDSTNDFRFVMASRHRPSMDVAKLQLQGTLYIVSAAQISFTQGEVAALLGRDYTDELVTSLYDRTHGWPVAVKLFAVAAERHKDSPQALLATIAEVPDVASYLTEQVMSHLTASLETFLMVTSLPARITGDLANKLCERTDGERTLQQLEKDGLFIIRAEERGGGYRYHDFFRDFLRNRLAQQSTFDVGVLHKRAAEWFLAARQLDDALKHSLQAGAWQLAIGILENEGGWHIALKHGGNVLHGIEAIPDAAMQPSLLARLTLVFLLLHFGQTDRARDTFEQLRADSDDFTHWRGETIAATVRAECHALEAIVIIDEERPLSVAFVEKIKEEAQSVGSRGRFVRIVTDSGLAIYANYDAGNYRECVRLAEQGFVALKDIDANFGLGYLYIYVGMSHFALGRLHLAQLSYRKALDLAATRFPHESQRVEALACIAETQYYEDDLEGARRNIDAALAGLMDQAAVDGPVFQVTYLTAAALYARAQDLDSALSLLMEARAVAQYLHREHRLANIDIRRVEELTRAGYCADAKEIIQQEGFQRALTATGELSCIPLRAMTASLALARFELATRNIAGAYQRLATLHANSEEFQNELLKLKCLTLLAASQFAVGDYVASMQSARSLCSRIIPLGLKRVVADEKAFILPVLEYALDKGERPGTAAYANAQIILDNWLSRPADAADRAYQEDCAAVAIPPVPPGVLSPRQREVLELLAAGLSGKEIATRLRLSESTIKSYRKSLYARLRAGRRSQALANARRMSLLP